MNRSSASGGTSNTLMRTTVSVLVSIDVPLRGRSGLPTNATKTAPERPILVRSLRHNGALLGDPAVLRLTHRSSCRRVEVTCDGTPSPALLRGGGRGAALRQGRQAPSDRPTRP